MAYKPESRENFMKYLTNGVHVNPSLDEAYIYSFQPTGLSSLYELFTRLKDKTLSETQFNIVTRHINLYFDYTHDISVLIHNPITEAQITALAEIIKDTFVEIVKKGNPRNIPEDEQQKLKSIVNKFYPEIFTDFIEEPISVEELAAEQRLLLDAVNKVSTTYNEQSSSDSQTRSDYLRAAIYVVYRRLYDDQLAIQIPARTKGLRSYINNQSKEFQKALENTLPSELEKGISVSDLQKQFLSSTENPKNFIDKVDSDFGAMTIVLNHVDDLMYFEEEDPENSEIIRLKKQRSQNASFIHSLRNYLSKNDIFITEEEYYQAYIQLLQRLQESTYPECTHEIESSPYSTRLQYAIETYKKNSSSDSFLPSATSEQIETLYTLINCLKRRIDDKLQSEILDVTFPHVIEELKKMGFNIIGRLIKKTRKENGFCATYYEIKYDDGKKEEMQLQSLLRYKNSKNNHNDMSSKKIEISNFFELSDNANKETDSLDDCLSILSRTSKEQTDTKRERLASLKAQLTNTTLNHQQKAIIQREIMRIENQLQTIQTALDKIKIKDKMPEETNRSEYYESVTTKDGNTVKLYTPLPNNERRIEYTDINPYLIRFAEYHSPTSMSVVSSAHANAPEAHINKKTLLESFSDVLRYGDEITYLSELLLDKLKEALNIKEDNNLSEADIKLYLKQHPSSKQSTDLTL